MEQPWIWVRTGKNEFKKQKVKTAPKKVKPKKVKPKKTKPVKLTKRSFRDIYYKYLY